MDPEYRIIFQDLYSGLSNARFTGEFKRPEDFALQRYSSTIRQAIDDADGALQRSFGRRLRSDAKYFLLVNLTQMVFVPAQLRNDVSATEGALADLNSFLPDDLTVLLNEAAFRQDERDRRVNISLQFADREISSHSLIEALAVNWSRLKVNGLRVWGER